VQVVHIVSHHRCGAACRSGEAFNSKRSLVRWEMLVANIGLAMLRTRRTAKAADELLARAQELTANVGSISRP
jgi:hypothetical protein